MVSRLYKLLSGVCLATAMILLIDQGETRCIRHGEHGDDVIQSADCESDEQQQQQQLSEADQRAIQQFQSRERAKQLRIYAIQHSIWEQIGPIGTGRRPPVGGMEGGARINQTQMSEREIQALEAALRRSEQNHERTVQQSDYHAKIYQAIRPSCTQPSTWTQEDQSSNHRPAFRLYFDLDLSNLERPRRPNRELKVEKADLMLSLKLRGNEGLRHSIDRRQLEVVVHSYTKQVRHHRRDSKRLITRQLVTPNSPVNGHWMAIDIHDAVEDWLRRPTKNYGLQVTVTQTPSMDLDAFGVFEYNDCNSTSRISLPLNLPNDEDYDTGRSNETPRDLDLGDDTDILGRITSLSPYLKLTTAEVQRVTSSGRQKRDSTGEANKPARPSTCVMEKITVPLGELGYGDRVIIPQMFETAYCKGYCPLGPQLPRNSAVPGSPLNLPNQASTQDFAPHSCCGPTKLKPLNILQSGERGLYITTLDDVIVTECGCRV